MSDVINALSEDSLNLLGNLMEKKKLVLFVGSGISIDSKMPSWDNLSLEFLALCRKIFEVYKKSFNEEIIHNINIIIEKISNSENQRKPDILDAISVFRNFLDDIDHDRVNEIFKEWFIGLFGGSSFNENHEYIVSTNYPIILTTNYDRLLTEAAGKLGYMDLFKNSFGLTTYKDAARCIYEEESFILNIHGKAIEVQYDNIVLTKKDYVKIMRDLPSLRMILETIFIKYPILFVGYGMSDPHLEELIEEISFSFNYSENNVRKFFIVIREDKVDFIRKNIKMIQGVTLLTVDNKYEQSKRLLKFLSEQFPRSYN